MGNRKNSVEISKSQANTLQKNGAAANRSASSMVGNLIDDQFGGRSVGGKGNSSIKAVQNHVDKLEKILKSK